MTDPKGGDGDVVTSGQCTTAIRRRETQLDSLCLEVRENRRAAEQCARLLERACALLERLARSPQG
jgi:hypothetical protein